MPLHDINDIFTLRTPNEYLGLEVFKDFNCHELTINWTINIFSTVRMEILLMDKINGQFMAIKVLKYSLES